MVSPVGAGRAAELAAPCGGARVGRWLDRKVEGRAANPAGTGVPAARRRLADGAVPAMEAYAGGRVGRRAEAVIAGASTRQSSRRGEPCERGGNSFELTSGDLGAVQEGLQALSAAMVLLDAAGRLLFANHVAQALLAQADGIAIDPSNVVRCRDREAQKALRRFLDRPVDQLPRSGAMVPVTFPIRREFGLPLVALVISRPDGALAAPGERRTVLLLRDPERELGVASDLLTTLFGLSNAEAAVVSRLAAGISLEQIADERGVSLITVRNQLKSALGKSGVSRQVELVSIVLRAIQF